MCARAVRTALNGVRRRPSTRPLWWEEKDAVFVMAVFLVFEQGKELLVLQFLLVVGVVPFEFAPDSTLDFLILCPTTVVASLCGAAARHA